jgi:hypothetical protein
MAIIKRGSSSESFLIYKLLMRAPTTGASMLAPPFDLPNEKELAAHAASELGEHIPGEPMPKSSSPLSWDDLRLLRRWIDDGAAGCTGYVPPSDAGVDSSADTGDAGPADAPAEGGG